MIISLTKLYCPSDLEWKRTPMVYQNVTQYNNQQQTQLFMLCDVLKDSGHSFLVKVRWTIYFTWCHCHDCVVFLIIILCNVLIDSGRSFLLKVRWTKRTSRNIIINKNTAMLVSLTKIYCPSDVKKKRTPTVY
jgi:hypothetical protein